MSTRARRPKTVLYLSAKEVAEIMGIPGSTLQTWRARYPRDFPQPDSHTGAAGTGSMDGWLPSREAELRAWRPPGEGQGSPGVPKSVAARRNMSAAGKRAWEARKAAQDAQA